MSRFKETAKTAQEPETTTGKQNRWTVMIREGDFELMVQGEGKEDTVDLFERMLDRYGRANNGREHETPQTPVPVA